MKVLAVDFGSRRIGLAVGNSQSRVATPLGQIAAKNQRHVLDEIMLRITEFEIEQIVVGYPLNMDNSRGPACARVERFAASVGRRSGLPVALVDEKLSSFEAEEMGKEFEGNFRKRKVFLDSVAAQVILRTFFERP
ncbi:MAG TPA: Holliday junction resolvase RuvX [Candidatus Binatia bacterium]|nr:Holliday junction resolvase RuvX [Candidatus Binatia bacterium]